MWAFPDRPGAGRSVGWCSVNTFVLLSLLAGIAVILTSLWGFRTPAGGADAKAEGRRKLFGLTIALTIILALMTQ